VESVARNDRLSVEDRVAMLRALHAAGAELDRPAAGTPALFGAAMSFDADAVEAYCELAPDRSSQPRLSSMCFA